MTLPAVFPITVHSPLARIDPRWKLVALIPSALVVCSLRTLPPTVVGLLGAWLLAVSARIPLRWYAVRLTTLLCFLGLFLVFLPLVDEDGMMLALVLLLKAVAMVSLLLAAATTAPVETHLKALHALRVPGVLVHLTALTIRYLAVLLDEFDRMRIALRVRGYRQRATLRSLQVVAHVSGMLLVRGHDRAERVAHALRCRGFDGKFRALAQFRTRPVDVLFFMMIVGTAAALLLWDLAER